ncbi:hypothetical protein SprV_0200699600 [Sparganum proliferum]
MARILIGKHPSHDNADTRRRIQVEEEEEKEEERKRYIPPRGQSIIIIEVSGRRGEKPSSSAYHDRDLGLRQTQHSQTNACAINPTTPTSSPTLAPAANPAPAATPITADHTVAAPSPPSTDSLHLVPTPVSTATASSTTATTSPTDGTTSDVPSFATIATSTSTSSDEDSVPTCPHCNRTFTFHIGLVGHLRIHRTEANEPARGAPIYTHRIRPYCLTVLVHSLTAWAY